MRILLTFILLLSFTSCGPDKLKESLSKDQAALTAKECSGFVPSTPVCAFNKTDNTLHDYFSAQYAQCMGSEVQFEGHCDCHSNTILVCTEESGSISECEAKDKHFTITQYTPCNTKEL